MKEKHIISLLLLILKKAILNSRIGYLEANDQHFCKA